MLTQKNVKKTSESAVDLDSSVLDDTVEHHVFAFIAELAQRYSDYFVSVISTMPLVRSTKYEVTKGTFTSPKMAKFLANSWQILGTRLGMRLGTRLGKKIDHS